MTQSLTDIISNIRKAMEGLDIPEEPWVLQDRQIGTLAGREGNVIRPYRHQDGSPDIAFGLGVIAFLMGVQPLHIAAILSALKAERERADKAEDTLNDFEAKFDEAFAAALDTCRKRAEAAEKASEEYRLYAAEKSNQYIAVEASLKEAIELLKPFAPQGIHPSVSDARRLSYPLSHATVGDIRAVIRFLSARTGGDDENH